MCIDIEDIWFGIANGQISLNFDGVIYPKHAFFFFFFFFFSFSDDNLCKYQGSLTKLGTCIDIMEIWFGIAKDQISSMFDSVIYPRHNNGGVL